MDFNVIFANVKTQNNILLIKIFSVILGLYFLNISVNFYNIFRVSLRAMNVESQGTDNEQSMLIMQQDIDPAEAPDETGSAASNNPPAEEEEEKKSAHDDFYNLHNKHNANTDEIYLQRFHGVHFSGEFISEIIPPPPKA